MMKLQYIFPLVALMFGAHPIFCQGAPQIIIDLKEAYSGSDAVEVRFIINISEPEQPVKNSIGVYSQSKEKFKLESDFQRVYSDGTDVYVYDQQINEIQINTYDPDDESLLQLSPINLLATLEPDEFIFQTLQNGQIELRPEDNFADYKKIRLTIQDDKLHKAELFLDGNVKIDIEIITLDLHANHDKTDFKIPQKLLNSADVEDLRF